MQSMHRFAGRTAIVTGAARGIGRGIAERLASEGCKVAVWDIDTSLFDHSVSDFKPALLQSVNVASFESVQKAFDETLSTLGQVDILVNNAGINGPVMPVWDYPIEAWDKVLAVDLTGVFYCSRAATPHMRSRGYGRIVNVASIAGKEGNPNASAYSAAKAGVIALTKSLGKETAQFDIAVNAITPAAARTRIFEQMSQQHIDYMLSKIPRGRFVEVSEIASMVAWLASAENSFTTGAVFDLSGGRATY